MNYKKLFGQMLMSLIGVLICVALFVAIVDPYFHYHAPLEQMSYRLVDEKYTNVGILKNFEYLKNSGKESVIRTPLVPGITDT